VLTLSLCQHESVLNVDRFGDAGAVLRAAHGLHGSSELAGEAGAGDHARLAVAALMKEIVLATPGTRFETGGVDRGHPQPAIRSPSFSPAALGTLLNW
jgi:hypothetical protein